MPSATAEQVRKYLLTLVAAVVVLDGVVLAIYYGMHIADRPARMQETFVAVWVVLTLLVVTTIMKKLRQARIRRS